MKRKGETFAEFLAAITVFGILAAGISEFMAVQTQNTVRIRDWDNFMYAAQAVCSWSISRDITVPGGTANIREHNILHNIDHSIEAGKTGTYDYSNKDTGADPEFKIEHADEDSPVTEIQNIASFDWDKDNHALTVKKAGGATMSLTLRP